MKNIFFVSLLLFLTGSLAGCSSHKIWSTDNSEEGRKSATTIGAISGALLGGTIGAFADNNTGEGIIVGSIAGAALGTGTGAFVDYRNSGKNLNSKIKEKEIKINNDEIEIQKLRNDRKDRGVSKTTVGNKKNVNFYDEPRASLSYPTYRKGKPFTETLKEERSLRGQDKVLSRKEPLTAGKMLDKEDVKVASKKKDPEVKKMLLPVKTVKVKEEEEIVKDFVEEPKKVTKKIVSNNEEEIASGISSSGKGAVVAINKDIAKMEKKADDIKNEASKRIQAEAPEVKGDKCQQATAEADRGANSSSIADKLYYYKRAKQLCPGDSSYRYKLGKVYSELGKNDDAKNELKESIKLNPTNVEAKDELNYLENFGGIKE